MSEESRDDRERVAYHEAGHAVLHCEFGHVVEEAFIEPGANTQWWGQVKIAPYIPHIARSFSRNFLVTARGYWP